MNEHGYCPHCKADLDGEDIADTFKAKGYTEADALIAAADYGYGSGILKWDRRVGLYDINFDRVTGYQCPDCEKTWRR